MSRLVLTILFYIFRGWTDGTDVDGWNGRGRTERTLTDVDGRGRTGRTGRTGRGRTGWTGRTWTDGTGPAEKKRTGRDETGPEFKVLSKRSLA